MASKRAAVDTEPETPTEAGPALSVPAKPKPKRKKPSPPKAPRCGCRGDCRSSKCGCGKKGEACGDSCKCTGCKNPFNILKEYNINCGEAVMDKCLMDNIFKIEDLRGRLEKTYELDCCGASVQLKDMIPGVAGCTEDDCDGCEWNYSWCWDRFVDEENRPRYHCGKCRRCDDYRSDHCDRCNKCYFAGLSGFECPCKDRPPKPKGRLGSLGLMLWAMQTFAEEFGDGSDDDSEDEGVY